MADTNLRDKVISTIYPNGKGAINAADHQALLLDMVTEMAKTDLDVFILQKNKADKAAIPTKLSQLEQDIPIGSYDDTEIRQELTELSQEKEDKTNKVTSLTEESTDEQYPSAKVVYALKERIEENELLIDDLFDTKIDREADDYYPQLAVGLADNLSGVDVVDSEVNFRRSGGGAISDGVARIETIKGNSVVWNQLYPTGWNVTKEGITITSQNNIITANGTLTTTYFSNKLFEGNEVNHKYLFIVEGLSSAFNGASFSLLNRVGVKATISNGFSYIFHVNSDPSQGCNIGFSGLTTGAVISETYILRQIDLTKAFPNDWQNINTIEDFYARIPMGVDLNAYNEGEVIHMDVQSIESQGVNAWDEEFEEGAVKADGTIEKLPNRITTSFIKVLPNKVYYQTSPSSAYNGRLVIYDENKRVIYADLSNGVSSAANVFKTPSNAKYVRITFGVNYGTTYNHDICINQHDTSINGKYFPYVKRTEDLSIIRKYFPQGMKKAGSAHDEIRYNKATQKWEYSKGRFRSVDLGTFNWIQATATDGFKYYYTSKGLSDAAYENKGNNILTPRYTAAKKGAEEFADKDMRLFSDKLLYIRDDAYTDAASFKAAMQGVILYYESNDWEWVELDAEDQFKDLDYQVWNCGTEKAIAEGKSAPLAADITYGFNAIGKIKELESLVAALRAKVGI